MPKTPKSPTSLRIPDATRVRVEEWATQMGVPRNAAYVRLIERGLSGAYDRPALVAGLSEVLDITEGLAEPARVHVALPLGSFTNRGPRPKGGKRSP